LRTQSVNVSMLRMSVKLEAGETIHTEKSYKYTLSMVRDMLEPSGFELDRTWFDDRKWFALHLARV